MHATPASASSRSVSRRANRPEFPRAVLEPGERYLERCVYRFSAGPQSGEN
jgi:hypothetical protein